MKKRSDSRQNQRYSKSKPNNSAPASSQILIGKNSVLEALNTNTPISKIWYKPADSKSANDSRVSKILNLAREAKVPTVEASKQKLDELAGGEDHKSIVAQISPAKIHSEDYLVENDLSRILILANIEDPHNIGAIIRTAKAFSFDAVVIPNRRSAQINETIVSTSAGAALHLPIVRIGNVIQCVEKLKKSNFWIYGTDCSSESEDYSNVKFDNKTVLILGNEKKGLGESIKKHCDFLVHIPIEYESLNVSVATGVILSKIYNDIKKDSSGV